jgi:hypothetical protein
MSDLLNVIDQHEVDHAETFYRFMKPPSYETLEFLHGRRVTAEEGVELPWGHNLFARFAILQFPIPERFVAECFTNFLDLLWLRMAEDELTERVLDIEAMQGDVADVDETGLLSLQRDILETRERARNDELRLAEEASAYRSAGGARYLIAPNPRGYQGPKRHALVAEAA